MEADVTSETPPPGTPAADWPLSRTEKILHLLRCYEEERILAGSGQASTARASGAAAPWAAVTPLVAPLVPCVPCLVFVTEGGEVVPCGVRGLGQTVVAAAGSLVPAPHQYVVRNTFVEVRGDTPPASPRASSAPPSASSSRGETGQWRGEADVGMVLPPPSEGPREAEDREFSLAAVLASCAQADAISGSLGERLRTCPLAPMDEPEDHEELVAGAVPTAEPNRGVPCLRAGDEAPSEGPTCGSIAAECQRLDRMLHRRFCAAVTGLTEGDAEQEQGALGAGAGWTAVAEAGCTASDRVSSASAQAGWTASDLVRPGAMAGCTASDLGDKFCGPPTGAAVGFDCPEMVGTAGTDSYLSPAYTLNHGTEDDDDFDVKPIAIEDTLTEREAAAFDEPAAEPAAEAPTFAFADAPRREPERRFIAEKLAEVPNVDKQERVVAAPEDDQTDLAAAPAADVATKATLPKVQRAEQLVEVPNVVKHERAIVGPEGDQAKIEDWAAPKDILAAVACPAAGCAGRGLRSRGPRSEAEASWATRGKGKGAGAAPAAGEGTLDHVNMEDAVPRMQYVEELVEAPNVVRRKCVIEAPEDDQAERAPGSAAAASTKIASDVATVPKAQHAEKLAEVPNAYNVYQRRSDDKLPEGDLAKFDHAPAVASSSSSRTAGRAAGKKALRSGARCANVEAVVPQVQYAKKLAESPNVFGNERAIGTPEDDQVERAAGSAAAAPTRFESDATTVPKAQYAEKLVEVPNVYQRENANEVSEGDQARTAPAPAVATKVKAARAKAAIVAELAREKREAERRLESLREEEAAERKYMREQCLEYLRSLRGHRTQLLQGLDEARKLLDRAKERVDTAPSSNARRFAISQLAEYHALVKSLESKMSEADAQAQAVRTQLEADIRYRHGVG
jgi:hypothetical protein